MTYYLMTASSSVRPLWTVGFSRTGRSATQGIIDHYDGELAHVWALEDASLILKSIWELHEDVAAGKLEVVLPQQQIHASPIHSGLTPIAG
jgi:hypothetical protein